MASKSNPLKDQHAHPVSDLVEFAKSYGESTAAGQDSIMSLATKVYSSARYSTLTTGDMGQVWLAYCEGQNSTQFGAKVDTSNANSMKAGKSKLTRFVTLAKSPVGGFDIVTRTIGRINKRNADLNKTGKAVKTGGYYEQVLKVVRTQIKSKVKLTDDEIDLALFPVAAPKAELETLEALLKAATSAAEKPEFLTNSAYFARIQAAIQSEIDSYKANVLGTGSDDTSSEDDNQDVDLSSLDDLQAAA